MGRFDSLRDATRRALWWASTPAGLAWLFFGGLALRLVLAPAEGFPYDMASFRAWSERLASFGPGGFYPGPGDEYFVDYPPGYLYVLWGIGEIARLTDGAAPAFLVKLPAIAADLIVAALAVVAATRLTPAAIHRRTPVAAIAAIAVLFNPAIFFVSSVWGQVDSVQAAIVLGAFVLLGTGRATFVREAGGMALLAIAILTKPQAAFVVPVALLILLWRHVRTAFAEADEPRAQTVAPVLAAVGRIAGVGLVALVASLVVAAPFGIGIELGGGAPIISSSLVEFYQRAAQTYTVTSVFAFNLWGVIGFWRQDLQGADAVQLLGIPALYIGLALFAVLGILVLYRAWRALVSGEIEGRTLVFGGAALVLVAFSVLTRIHERYLFLALVLLVPLLGYRRLRWSFVLLSLLYAVNVYFPYVYYLEFDNRPAPRIPVLFDLLYGTGLASPQLKALSLGTAAAALFVAWRGWAWLRVPAPEAAAPAPLPVAAPVQPAEEAVERPRRRWELVVHPVGARGAGVALVAFVVALAIRLPGLAHPPGMYFDEVYHARTGGEYLQGKEVYEWTHPPLAKELMAASIAGLSDFGVSGTGPAPEGIGRGVASDTSRVLWTEPLGATSSELRAGDLDEGCRIIPRQRTRVAAAATAVAAVPGIAYVGGVAMEGPVLVRLDEGREVWRASLPGPPADIAPLGEGALTVVRGGEIFWVSGDGEAASLGMGAEAVDAADGAGWATFPEPREVVSYASDGTPRYTVSVQGRPGPIAAPAGADRVLVSTTAGIEAIDTESGMRTDELTGVRADALGTAPARGLVWAALGDTIRVIEPRGLSVLGTIEAPAEPDAFFATPSGDRLVAVAGDDLICVGGQPAFAWRFGSAVFGSAIVAAVALIAMRLFGSVVVAALGALFAAVDGLGYALSKIAMNDAYVTAFVLAAWFCALGCLYRWGRGVDPSGEPLARSRVASIGWLAATGVFAGLAVSSKWVGLYALAGIGLLFAWDMASRRWDGVLSLAGRPRPESGVLRSASLAAGTLGMFGVLLIAVPAGIYVASYLPYFSLGHTFGDLLRLQQGMYGYHANLTADHPYGSPWYMWPVGRRPVWLYLGEGASGRAEIWTVGNPVVLLGGLVAMGAAAAWSWRRRSAVLALVVGAAAIQYLPWIAVGRVTFLYHYFPVLPFAGIALAWWLAGRSGTAGRRMQIGVAAAAVAAFVLLLPVLDGWTVPAGYIDAVKNVLFWMF